jgi:hypothetical protein
MENPLFHLNMRKKSPVTQTIDIRINYRAEA